MLASHAVGSWSFSREWRFCIFQRLWLVLCWFTVFLRVLHLEWCAGLQVCNCVSVCVCICRLWWWRSCSDQLLLSNQPPAVSSPPASSTFAGKSVNVELSGQEGLSIHRKHKTSTAWFSCCISVPVTHGKNPSLSTATKGKRLIHQTTFYKQQMLHQNSKQTQIRPLWVSLRPGWLHAN